MTGSASLEGCRPGRLGLALRGPLRGRLRVRKTGKLPRSRGAALCARAIWHGTKRRLHTYKGRRSAERRVVETAPRYRSVARLYCGARGARRFWRTRSPSGALPRLSPIARLSPVPRFMAASTCATRAASSSQTGQFMAHQIWPAGRISEPPADGVTSPIPGTAPAPSIDRHRLTSLRRRLSLPGRAPLEHSSLCAVLQTALPGFADLHRASSCPKASPRAVSSRAVSVHVSQRTQPIPARMVRAQMARVHGAST